MNIIFKPEGQSITSALGISEDRGEVIKDAVMDAVQKSFGSEEGLLIPGCIANFAKTTEVVEEAIVFGYYLGSSVSELMALGLVSTEPPKKQEQG
jgi:hypothetical protein